MNKKKLIGSLILSFLLFGTASTIKTSINNNQLEVKDVLGTDFNNNSGRTVTPKRADEVSVKSVADTVKVQQRSNEDGTYDMRFLAGISSYELNRTVFHVTINNGTKDVTKDVEIKSVYTGLTVGEDTLTSAEIFGEGYDYLVAYAISGIPESALSYTYSASLSIFETADGEALDSSEVKTTTLQEIVDADKPVAAAPYEIQFIENDAGAGAWIGMKISWTDSDYAIKSYSDVSATLISNVGGVNYSASISQILTQINITNSFLYMNVVWGAAHFRSAACFENTLELEITSNSYIVSATYVTGSLQHAGKDSIYELTYVSHEATALEKYNVSYVLNDGTNNVYQTISQVKGKVYNLPTTNPSREGYKFTGWYTASENGDKISSTTIANISSDTTIYAQWESTAATIYDISTIKYQGNQIWFSLYWIDDQYDITEFLSVSNVFTVNMNTSETANINIENIDNTNNKTNDTYMTTSAGHFASGSPLATDGTIVNFTVTVLAANGSSYNIFVEFQSFGNAGNGVSRIPESVTVTEVVA